MTTVGKVFKYHPRTVGRLLRFRNGEKNKAVVDFIFYRSFKKVPLPRFGSVDRA